MLTAIIPSPYLAARKGELALSAGDLRVFDDERSVWFIREGMVELFAIQRKGGIQTGPREHLCTLHPGSLIWGIGQDPRQDGIHMLALSCGESVLTELDIDTIESWGRDTVNAEPLIEALDQWILKLSQGVTRHITPRKPPKFSIIPGEDILLAETDRVISRKHVTWARLDGGTAFYIDIAEIGYDGEAACVPLTPRGWLRIGSARKIEGLSTGSVLERDDIGRRMGLFHRWIFHNLAYGFRNSAAQENARLRQRASWIISETESLFARFAQLFDENIHHPTPDGGKETLFNVCDIVGRAMGVSMRAPAHARRRRAEDPPMNIEEIATASQLRLRRVTLEGRWWTMDNGPMVAFLVETGQPVALLQHNPTSMTFLDPVAGKRQPVTADLAADLSVTAYTFYASLPNRAVTPFDLLSLCLRHCKSDLVSVLFAGCLGGLASTAIPLATGYVFDEIVPGHQISQMFQIAGAMIAVALSASIFEFTRGVAQLRIEGRLSGILQAAVMDRLLRLPVGFFSTYSAGDLAQRTMMVEFARKCLSGVILGSLISGSFSIFSFALLIYYSPLASLLAALSVLILLAASCFSAIRIMSAAARVQEISGRLNGRVLEFITGITKLRLAGAEERTFNNWGGEFRLQREQENLCRRRYNSFAVFWKTYEPLCLTAVFAIFGVLGAHRGHGLSTGVFLAFVAAFSSLLISVYSLGRSLIELLAVIPLYRRAAPILQAIPENDPDKTDPGILRGDIEVTGVFFRYAPNLPHVLKGLSLSVSAGELIAVVGASGSGKTTLIRLLLGLDRPESGAVYLDGKDLRGLSLTSVRRQQGVVLQSGRLMPGSLYENIRGVSQATIEDCWEAAARAGLADDIKAMPMQMHTIITEGGGSLSGGQIQRVLIAKALAGKPAILLLDEATSALDSETQAVVTKTLSQLSVTRIVIAHRLSTVMNADRIYVLDNGQMAECGTFDELMARKNSLFQALASRQRL